MNLRKLFLEVGVLDEVPKKGKESTQFTPPEWLTGTSSEVPPSTYDPNDPKAEHPYVSPTAHKVWGTKHFKKEPWKVGSEVEWSQPDGDELFWNFYGLYTLWNWAGSGLEASYGPSPTIDEPLVKWAMAGRVGRSPYDVHGHVPSAKGQEVIDKAFYKVLRTTADALVFYLKRACILELQHIDNSNFPSFIYKIHNASPVSWDTFVTKAKHKFPSADPEFLLRLLGWYGHYKSSSSYIFLYEKLKSSHEDFLKTQEKEKKDADLKAQELQKWFDEPINDKDLYDIEKEPKNIEEPPESPEDFQDYPHEPEQTFTGVKKDPSGYIDHDVYWDPEQQKLRKHKLTEIGVYSYEGTEKVESTVGLKRIRKVHQAMKKVGMTYQDVVDAYRHGIWEDNTSFGGEAWGEGMEAALFLEKLMQKRAWTAAEMKDIAYQVDHIYDLNHNTGKLLNKGYVYVSQSNLDKRAKATSPARFLKHVSPWVRRLMMLYLPHMGSSKEDAELEDTLTNSNVPIPPKQSEFLKNRFGFFDDGTGKGGYRGSYNWSQEKRAGKKVNIIHHTTPLFIKKYADGTYTFNDEMMTDVKKFKNFGSLVKYVQTQYGNSLSKSGNSSSYKSTSGNPGSDYISKYTKIKLSPDKEDKLKSIQFGWRPTSFRYRAEAHDGYHLYLYALDNGKFVYIRKNTAEYKIFNKFDEAFAHLANISFNKVKPLTGTTAPDNPSPSSPPTTPSQKTSSKTSTKTHGLDASEYQSLKNTINATFNNAENKGLKWEVHEQPNGIFDVVLILNAYVTPRFSVGKVLPHAEFVKPYVLIHHADVGNYTYYFQNFEDLTDFIVSHADGLATIVPLSNEPNQLPPNAPDQSHYKKGETVTPIRLTKEDENKLAVCGFKVLMGDTVKYVHQLTNDIVRFFSNDSAKIHFATKKGAYQAATNFGSVISCITYIESKYTSQTVKSPLMAPKAGTIAGQGSPIAGVQAGKMFEKYFAKAGLIWNPEKALYEDSETGAKLAINKNYSGVVEFGDGSVKSFNEPDSLAEIVQYIKTEYPAEAEQKKGSSSQKPPEPFNPIIKPEEFENLSNILSTYGYTYHGVTFDGWRWKDASEQTVIDLSVYGNVTLKDVPLKVEKHWNNISDFLHGFVLDKVNYTTALKDFGFVYEYMVLSDPDTGNTSVQFKNTSGDKIIITLDPKSLTETNKSAYTLLIQNKFYVYNSLKELVDALTNVYGINHTSSESDGFSKLDQSWLINEVPKLSSQTLHQSYSTKNVQYFTAYNVHLFSVKKGLDGVYYLTQYTNNGETIQNMFVEFIDLKNYIINNIEKLSIGEKLTTDDLEKSKTNDKFPLYVSIENKKLLENAQFQFIGQTSDNLGDVFKNFITQYGITLWDDHKVSYWPIAGGSPVLYNSFEDFRKGVLENKAMPYWQWIQDNSGEDEGEDDTNGGNPLTPLSPTPIMPSGDGKTLSESEANALQNLATHYNIKSEKLQNSEKEIDGVIIKLESHQYIVWKYFDYYKIYWRKSADSSWIPLTPEYSLVKSANITTFSEVYGYVDKILQNITKKTSDEPDDKSINIPPSEPSGETYKTTNDAASMHRVKLNAHDESFVSVKGFEWIPDEYNYRDSSDNKLVILSNGTADFYNSKEYIGKSFASVPEALKWLQNSSNYSVLSPPAQKLITLKYLDNIPKGIQLESNKHVQYLKEHGYTWMPGNDEFSYSANFYYNPDLDQAIVVKKVEDPIYGSKFLFTLYYISDSDQKLQEVVFNSWFQLTSYIKGQETTVGTSKDVKFHDYDTYDKDKIEKIIPLINKDSVQLEKVGFKLTHEFGYPLYVHENGDQVAFYNSDMAHYQSGNEDTYFHKDGTVDGWNKKGTAPIDTKHGGVHNAIATIVDYFAAKNIDKEFQKPEYPEKLSIDYNKSPYDGDIKLASVEHKLMEDMGYQLTYDASPVYEKGNTQVRFHSNGNAEIFENDKLKIKLPILAALQALYTLNYGFPTENPEDEDKLNETAQKMADIGYEFTGTDLDIKGGTITIYANKSGHEAQIQEDGTVVYYKTTKTGSKYNGTFNNVDAFVDYVENENEGGDAEPFSNESAEHKTLIDAGFGKTDMGNGVIWYMNPDGTNIQINKKSGQINYTPGSYSPDKSKSEKLFAYDSPKENINHLLRHLAKYYGKKEPSPVENEPSWTDLKQAIKDYGFGPPKPINDPKVKVGHAVEYEKIDTGEFLTYFPGGSSEYVKLQTKPGNAVFKKFKDVYELYGFLKGDPQYTGKKIPIPDALKEVESYGFIKVMKEPHQQVFQKTSKDGKTIYQVNVWDDGHMDFNRWIKIKSNNNVPVISQQWSVPLEQGLTFLKKEMEGMSVDNTTIRLAELGFKYINDKSPSGGYLYRKHDRNSKHEEIYHEVELIPNGSMKYTVFMKDATGNLVPMTKKDFNSISDGLKQLQAWMGKDNPLLQESIYKNFMKKWIS